MAFISSSERLLAPEIASTPAVSGMASTDLPLMGLLR
jgi:hypothetical protein